MFKIEKNVPMPEASRGKRSLYPWHEMKAGDSFFVPLGTSRFASLTSLRNSLTSSGNSALGAGMIAARADLENNGVRVWRLPLPEEESK